MAIQKASDLNLTARLKQVAKLHFRGFSRRKIAEMMEYDEASVRRDLAQITSQIQDHDNLGLYLNDLIARTGEQIVQLDEVLAEQWKLLEWCTENVVQTDAFGNAVPELDLATGQIKKVNGFPVPQTGPRKPSMVPTVTAQIQSTLKQKAELLKLIGPKVDISVKLQIQEQTQARILEAIRDISTKYPEIYGSLYRELQIIAETADQLVALPAGVQDAIDAEFEVADAG